MPDIMLKDSTPSNEIHLKGMKKRSSWCINPSKYATKTVNPIRQIVETLDLQPNPDKPMIPLSIGDPTIFGNLKPCPEIVEAMLDSVRSLKYNGYTPSVGTEEARDAVAKYCSVPGAQLTSKDVILTAGCSMALDLCISVLANPGQNILCPRPGFLLYRTLSEGLGIQTKYYNLLPDQGWEVDLENLESQIDSRTAAIVINNPSNPCGSVFSKQHLMDILDIAQRNCVPIIADEIYDYFVFPGFTFHPIASLTTEVPILTCGGLTKRYLIPGWRMGWILIHDKKERFGAPIRKGLVSLSQRLLGSHSLIQGALPAILKNTPKQFFEDTIAVVKNNSTVAYDALSNIPGLKPVKPTGAMYMMVGIDKDCFPEYESDLDFVQSMVAEESVFCLPGQCFEFPNYFRIVLTVPEEHLKEACHRIRDFCLRHFRGVRGYNDNSSSQEEAIAVTKTAVELPV